jgi:O-antigen/teichoic acid export membrane protein
VRSRLSPLLTHARLPLHRNAYALVASAASTAVLGLAYWSLAARTYEPVAIGTQSAILSAMLLLGGVAEVGLDTVLIRFLPGAADGRRLLLRAYAGSATAAVVVACVFVVGTSVWSPPLEFMRSSVWWFAGFVLATVTTCVFALQDSVLTGMRRATWVPIENSLVSVLKIGLLLAFADVLTNAGIFVSWLIPGLLAVAFVNVLVFRRLFPTGASIANGTNSVLSPRDLIRYAFGNYIGSLFALVTINVLPLVVIGRLGATSTAYFFMPWAIYNGLQLFATSISYSLVVEVAGDPDKLRSYFRRALAQTMAIVVPVAVLLALFGPKLLALFGGRYAAEGGSLLRWLAIAVVPGAMVPVTIALARLRNRGGVVALIQAVSSVLLLSLSYFLLADYGIKGVGIAALTSTLVVGGVLARTVLWPVIRPSAVGSRSRRHA